jgi:Tol biopolymer transport system component
MLFARGFIWLPLLLTAADAIAQSFNATQNPDPRGLWITNVDGSNQHKFDLYDYECNSPSWSPDGKLIVLEVRSPSIAPRESQVAIVRADGTGLRTIGSGNLPSWSPDGIQIICFDSDLRGVVVMNPDGTGREKIYDGWAVPRWSPKGDWVGLVDRNCRLSLLDLATGKSRRVSFGRKCASGEIGISPDGKRVAFGDPGSGICVATLDHKSATIIKRAIPNGKASGLSWAPDGKRIVFAGNLDGQLQEHLFVLDVDTGTTSSLSRLYLDKSDVSPCWSPDGKAIIFTKTMPLSQMFPPARPLQMQSTIW